MTTIDAYLDAAKRKSGAKSDRDLDRHLGNKSTSVSMWRTKRAWPSDDAMVRLAGLAEMDETQALLDLNIWRSTGQARAVYERIAAGILTAATLALALFSGPTHAGTVAEQSNPCNHYAVYYGKSRLRRLAQWIGRRFAPDPVAIATS